MSVRLQVALGIFATGCASQLFASDLPPELAEVQKKMAGQSQLHLSGEQVYFLPPSAESARMYEHFTLAFDRDSQRLRLSYLRLGGAVAPRTEIEVWGTLDCLNLLRADRTPPGLVQAKSQLCSKQLDPVFSMLSEGIGIASAPVVVLSGMVRDTFWPHAVGPHRVIALEHNGGHTAVTFTYDNIPSERDHYWLSNDASRVVKADHIGQGDRWRAVYRLLPAPTDADFAYVPDPDLLTLAEIGKNPQANRDKLQALARRGNKAAELQLAFTEEVSMVMYFGWPKGQPEMTERTWTTLDELEKKGFGSAALVQARWLARAEAADVPAKYRALSAEERKTKAREFFWAAARACDNQALYDLPRALSMGDEMFEPNPLKLAEFESVQKRCDDELTPPELKAAAEKVKDPWP